MISRKAVSSAESFSSDSTSGADAVPQLFDAAGDHVDEDHGIVDFVECFFKVVVSHRVLGSNSPL